MGQMEIIMKDMKADFISYIESKGYKLSGSSISLQLPFCEYFNILHFKKDNDLDGANELMFKEYDLDGMHCDRSCRDGVFCSLDNNFFDDFNSDIFLKEYGYE